MTKNIIFILFICSSKLLLAQSEGITPMHKFFQQYADSTLIIEYPTYGYATPSYKVLSNLNDTINCFLYTAKDTTYNNIIKYPTGLPKTLGILLSLHKTNFSSMPADINIFFNYVKKPADTTKKMWQQIKGLNPWQMVDDKSYPTCPPDKIHAAVVDGPYYILHLITKKEIKTLIYYYPSFYEKEACPGNKNRQAILKIYAIFDKYFNNR